MAFSAPAPPAAADLACGGGFANLKPVDAMSDRGSYQYRAEPVTRRFRVTVQAQYCSTFQPVIQGPGNFHETFVQRFIVQREQVWRFEF